jgi:hypothetical protein
MLSLTRLNNTATQDPPRLALTVQIQPTDHWPVFFLVCSALCLHPRRRARRGCRRRSCGACSCSTRARSRCGICTNLREGGRGGGREGGREGGRRKEAGFRILV